MNKLSIKQKQVIEAIEYFIDKNKYSPTYSELSKLLKCTNNATFKKVMLLEQKGYIKTDNGKARSIIIIKKIEDDKL